MERKEHASVDVLTVISVITVSLILCVLQGLTTYLARTLV